MKTLPVKWAIDFEAESKSPLLEKFKEWYAKRHIGGWNFSYRYYGENNELQSFGDRFIEIEKIITLKEWNIMAFGEQFEKGEEVLVRDSDWSDTTTWVTAIFIAEFDGKFVVDWDGVVNYFDRCKKKPSELDMKIEELKKLAEEKGVKLTLICE